MSGSFTESIVEQAALARLESAGWQINALLAVSDGVEARVGTIGAGREWFKPWRTIAGETLAGAHLPELAPVP